MNDGDRGGNPDALQLERYEEQKRKVVREKAHKRRLYPNRRRDEMPWRAARGGGTGSSRSTDRGRSLAGDVAVACHVTNAVMRGEHPQQSAEPTVLRGRVGCRVGALELDADRKVVAARAAAPGRLAGMPCAGTARDELQQRARATDQEVRRDAQAGDRREVRMGVGIEAAGEQSLDRVAAEPARRQRIRAGRSATAPFRAAGFHLATDLRCRRDVAECVDAGKRRRGGGPLRSRDACANIHLCPIERCSLPQRLNFRCARCLTEWSVDGRLAPDGPQFQGRDRNLDEPQDAFRRVRLALDSSRR